MITLLPNCKSISVAAYAFFNSLWISYCVIPSFNGELLLSKASPTVWRLTVAAIPVFIGITSPLLNKETLSPLTSCDLSITDLWTKSDDLSPTGVVDWKSNFIRLAVL